ncbi:WD repeat-containing protein 75-like [Acipenser ruthenus]|uniref:WD repeat-containing protein 75-like n=1 Tax=Acipenser ruthenus TaxID=7906 RepID=UPI00145B4312|nr:WD repeat-containing protein 75-like [Acipenser ruthenus]
MVEQGEIRVVRCGGSTINYRKAIFTLDSKYLLCTSGDMVKVYSTATEECVHVLQGHTNLVTGIALNPTNHLQVYSCSMDGTIKLWDFTDNILIKTFTVGYKLLALYTSKAHEGCVFVIIPKENDEALDSFQLVAVRLPKSSDQEVAATELSFVLNDVSQLPKCTSYGREGEFVASVKGLHLTVYFFRNQKTYRLSLNATPKKGANNIFTCVACHPKEDCIATGHEDGKIRLWRNFNRKKEYTHSTHHWHHSAVNDLSFTPEGTNLLSGGIESVLVQWRYGEETKKDFLPRLGAAIAHISTSPEGSLYCTSHSDNKITIIQSNLRVSAVIQGLVKGDNIKTDLMIDPRTKALVLNGKPGHLQFYSLQHDKQLYNLDIVQQEYINQSGLHQFDVVKAAFDAQGSWLATVEERKEKLADLEIQLKIWVYKDEMQSFVLNTTITSPHEDHITALCFCNTNETTMLVTTGRDGRFKAWVLGDDSDIYRESVCWSCDFVGTYHNLLATNCCFSEDGSLLAVGFEQIITIWNPNTWDLVCTFCQPPGKIKDLCFGRLSCSKYLLGTTTNSFLCCWNLLTCTLEWSVGLNVILLQLDPLSENVAAFSCAAENSDLFVFRPNEPRPVYLQKNICQGSVQRAVFTPRDVPEENCSESSQWLNRSQLYFLTRDMDLMTFSTKTEEDRLTSSSKQLLIEENVPVTPFYLLLGKHRQAKLDAENGTLAAQVQLPQGSVAIKELLQTPAHVLPSATFLCTMFVNSLLISKDGKSEVPEEAEEEMESEKEEDETSDQEMDSQHKVKPEYFVEELVPKLSKKEERDLKRVRKTDYSWLCPFYGKLP